MLEEEHALCGIVACCFRQEVVLEVLGIDKEPSLGGAALETQLDKTLDSGLDKARIDHFAVALLLYQLEDGSCDLEDCVVELLWVWSTPRAPSQDVASCISDVVW